MDQAKNSFINYIGKVNEATGASEFALASAIVGIPNRLITASRQKQPAFCDVGRIAQDASDSTAPLAGELNNAAEGAKAIGWYIKEAFITCQPMSRL